jgi:hypothetical protein
LQLARPVVSTATGFRADQACWQVYEQICHLVAPINFFDDQLVKLVDPYS